MLQFLAAYLFINGTCHLLQIQEEESGRLNKCKAVPHRLEMEEEGGPECTGVEMPKSEYISLLHVMKDWLIGEWESGQPQKACSQDYFNFKNINDLVFVFLFGFILTIELIIRTA